MRDNSYGISKAKGKTKLLVYLLFFLGLRVSEALKLKKKDIRYGDRLVTSVVGKGNKPRDVRAGKATSIFIWNVIKGLQDTVIEAERSVVSCKILKKIFIITVMERKLKM